VFDRAAVRETNLELLLPLSMQQQLDKFSEFYKSVNSSRTLQWMHSVGTVEMTRVVAGKRRIFKCTVAQAAALLWIDDEGASESALRSGCFRGNVAALQSVLASLRKASLVVGEDDELRINESAAPISPLMSPQELCDG
jgi:hypothetical protein